MLEQGATVLFASESSEANSDDDLQFVSDGVIDLQHGKGDVLKKRLSNFERTLRDIDITSDGIKVGQPLTQLRGLLTGIPDWIDDRDS